MEVRVSSWQVPSEVRVEVEQQRAPPRGCGTLSRDHRKGNVTTVVRPRSRYQSAEQEGRERKDTHWIILRRSNGLTTVRDAAPAHPPAAPNKSIGLLKSPMKEVCGAYRPETYIPLD